jgi:hypothetical protein
MFYLFFENIIYHYANLILFPCVPTNFMLTMEEIVHGVKLKHNQQYYIVLYGDVIIMSHTQHVLHVLGLT